MGIIQTEDFPVLDSPYAIPVTWQRLALNREVWAEFSAETLKQPITFALGEYLSDRLGVIVRSPFLVFADDGDMIYFKMWDNGRDD